jgi:hypothetical protein
LTASDPMPKTSGRKAKGAAPTEFSRMLRVV